MSSEPTIITKHYVLGADAKIYYQEGVLVAGSTLDTTNPPDKILGNVKDVSIKLTANKANTTTRDSGGWVEEVATLKSCTVDWEAQFKKGDPAYALVREAYLNNGLIRMAFLTDAYENGGDGPLGLFSITDLGREEPLEETIKLPITASLAKFERWVLEEDGG